MPKVRAQFVVMRIMVVQSYPCYVDESEAVAAIVSLGKSAVTGNMPLSLLIFFFFIISKITIAWISVVFSSFCLTLNGLHLKPNVLHVPCVLFLKGN